MAIPYHGPDVKAREMVGGRAGGASRQEEGRARQEQQNGKGPVFFQMDAFVASFYGFFQGKPMSFDLIEAARRLIGIRSCGEEGTEDVIRFVRPLCEKTGFHITLQTAPENPRDINLINHTAAPGSADVCPQGLALVTHLDTVPAGDPALWTETAGDPFRGTLSGDRLYGLGSADTKVDFLCKLQALSDIGVQNFSIPVALIGTFGEERSLLGTRLLQQSGLIHPRFALIGEPSQLKPVLAHKGIVYFEASCPLAESSSGRVAEKLTFHGKAAHGSMPHLGENAIEKALCFLFEEQKRRPYLRIISIHGGTVHNIVPEYCELKVMEGNSPCPVISFLKKYQELSQEVQAYLASHSNPAFDPPYTTANLGVVRTEKDRVRIEFDYRVIPETDVKKIEKIFEKSARVIRSNPPMKTDPSSEVVQRVVKALGQLNLPAEPVVKSGNTEGALFSQMGAQSVIIGPGRAVGNIHAPNEYNEISQLEKAVEFYKAFLKGFY